MEEAIPALTDLLKRFKTILPVKNGLLSRAHAMQHTIKLLPNSKPLYIHAYRLPHSKKEELVKVVDNMLSLGVCEPSDSPWNSPILLVPKKDGTVAATSSFPPH